jgi:hypothetical protein
VAETRGDHLAERPSRQPPEARLSDVVTGLRAGRFGYRVLWCHHHFTGLAKWARGAHFLFREQNNLQWL